MRDLTLTEILSDLVCKARSAYTNPDIKKHLSITSLAREYGTIKLCSHRMAGHSTAIMNVATSRSLILVGSDSEITHFEQHPATCLKLDGNYLNRLAGRKFDMVFIDNASYCDAGDHELLKLLYHPESLLKLFCTDEPLFIFME